MALLAPCSRRLDLPAHVWECDDTRGDLAAAGVRLIMSSRRMAGRVKVYRPFAHTKHHPNLC